MISNELQEILDKKEIKRMFKDISEGKMPDPDCYMKRGKDEKDVCITSLDGYRSIYDAERKE
jgi:hypothetical protein